MKPLHVVLLVAGAALAGGLAVKMTQPPQAPVAARVPVNQPGSPPAEVKAAPAPKPTPIPESPAPASTSAAAPAPVYSEPAKPAIRKFKPILTAKEKPTQWAPVRYEAAAKATPPKPDPFQPPTTSEPPIPQVPIPQITTVPAPVPLAEAVQLPPREATLRTGTTVTIRLDESLSSERSAAGDTFQASLDEPLVVDGLVIAEKGARVNGRIVDSQKAGRVSGTSLLKLGLTTLATADGQRVAISTDPWTKQGDTSHLEDAGKIGAGAALGAIIGAIAGGGKGAAIGAGVGGGAGAGTAMATRGKPVSVPSETVIRFRLASKVTITERQMARQ